MYMTDDIANSALAAFKAAFDDGFLYIYSGPVPADAEAALDMSTDHTQLARITLDGDGVTGLTWETPASRALLKPASAVWQGDAAFTGAEDTTPVLTATFARLVTSSGDPEVSTTTPRLQFTVSGPGGTGEIVLVSAAITESGPPVAINAAWIRA